jgi:hypothetical protein
LQLCQIPLHKLPILQMGHAVEYSVKAMCYRPDCRGFGFDSR